MIAPHQGQGADDESKEHRLELQRSTCLPAVITEPVNTIRIDGNVRDHNGERRGEAYARFEPDQRRRKWIESGTWSSTTLVAPRKEARMTDGVHDHGQRRERAAIIEPQHFDPRIVRAVGVEADDGAAVDHLPAVNAEFDPIRPKKESR